MIFELKTILFTALIITVLHILVSFSLKLPERYKNKFRVYSIIINLLFIVFLAGFFIYARSSSPNPGSEFYYNSLATFYILLFVPLGAVLTLLFHKVIMNADIYWAVLKYIINFGVAVVLIGAIVLGYSLFMLTFYGFAP